MDEKVQQLRLQHSKLIATEFAVLEQHTNEFYKTFNESKKLMEKLMLLDSIPELMKHVEVLRNIHPKHEKLCNDFKMILKEVKRNFLEHDGDVNRLSVQERKRYFETSIAHVMEKYSTKNRHSVNCTSSVHDAAPSPGASELTRDSDKCTNITVQSSCEQSCNGPLFTPFKSKKLKSSETVLCSGHCKFRHNLKEAGNLMSHQVGMYSVVEALLDQLMLTVRQQERQNDSREKDIFGNPRDEASNLSAYTHADEVIDTQSVLFKKNPNSISNQDLFDETETSLPILAQFTVSKSTNDNLSERAYSQTDEDNVTLHDKSGNPNDTSNETNRFERKKIVPSAAQSSELVNKLELSGSQILITANNKFTQKLLMANELVTCQLEKLSLIKVVLDQLLLKYQAIKNNSDDSICKSKSSKSFEKNFSITECSLSSNGNFSGSTLSESDCKHSKKQEKKLENKKAKKEKSSSGETCSFYVAHKKRFCRMLVAKGKKFCGQHLTADTSPDEKGRIRIPCPLDLNHSVYADALEQHLRVCNARAPVHLPYYCKDINAGHPLVELDSASCQEPCDSQVHNDVALSFALSGRPLADLTDDELLQLIQHVKSVEKSHTSEIERAVLSHTAVEAELESNALSGPSFRKHLLQNSSLVAHLQNLGALGYPQHPSRDAQISASNVQSESGQNDCSRRLCFLEFGAGRGELSHWVAAGSDVSQELQVVLIDRGAQRYKFDTRMGQAKNVSTKRLRLDIKDLWLERVPGLWLEGAVLAGGKHLCGAATDLTLRCLDRSVFRVDRRPKCGHSSNVNAQSSQSTPNQRRKVEPEVSSASSCPFSQKTLPEKSECPSVTQYSCPASSSLDTTLVEERSEGGLRRDGASAVASCHESRNCGNPGARFESSRGLVVALCCHHKCSWQHYVGKQFFKSIGLSGEEFPAVMGLTSWAVCAARPPAAARSASATPAPAPPAPDTSVPAHPASPAPTDEIPENSPGLKDIRPPGASSLRRGKPEEHLSATTDSTSRALVHSADFDQSISNNKNDGQSVNSPSESKAHFDGQEEVKALAEDVDLHEAAPEGATAHNRYARLGLSISEREEIGRAAKHIINHGRVQFLQSRGLEASLVQYVDSEVTLENVALVAYVPF